MIANGPHVKNERLALDHPGIYYLDALQIIAEQCSPSSYFEIGSQTGQSLARIACDSVCVDPRFRLAPEAFRAKHRLFCFQMTSDRFFLENSLRDYFRNGVDLAFLDGMHRFEFLLRDFFNTEAACHSRSIILLHDCLPPSAGMADRFSPTELNWTGDVWKLLLALKKYRPDLRVHYLDCPPSGLVVCTRLDARSTVLPDMYHGLLDEFGPAALNSDMLDRLWHLYPTLSSRSLAEHPYDLTLCL